jgi:UDP-4-amino-4,6-dideoxy-N-acetyl-beta-L-altrosamine transaminase
MRDTPLLTKVTPHSVIPYGRHSIDEQDIESVVNVLRSDWLTQGKTVEVFEKEVSKYCGVSHAVAVSNGTSALYLACLSLGVGRGDIVWTTPISFVASANCALLCGASVDFVDIDARTSNMSVEALERKLLRAEREGRLPKAVIVVHFAGLSCDMQAINALAQRYAFRIIEDACHALGARYKGNPVGCCLYSHMAVFSFHPVKSITTGEGGMIVTNDGELGQRLRTLRSHGITRSPEQMTKEPEGPWYYEQHHLGINARLTDIQAALGISQLGKLDEWIKDRSVIAARYETMLSELPVQTPSRVDKAGSSWHLYVIRVPAHDRREVFEALRDRGIGVQVHYIPIHLQPYFKNMGFKRGGFPEAERYYERCISLPLYPGLSAQQQDYVVRAVAEAVQ